MYSGGIRVNAHMDRWQGVGVAERVSVTKVPGRMPAGKDMASALAHLSHGAN